MKRICLLGVNDRAFVGCIRNLAKEYAIYAVDISYRNVGRSVLFRYRNYVADHAWIPTAQGVNNAISKITEYCKSNDLNIILPINDSSVEMAKLMRQKTPFKILYPYSEVGDYAHNKFELISLGVNSPIVLPEIYTTICNVEQLIAFTSNLTKYNLSFPLVCKPFHSSVVFDDHIQGTKVRIVSEPKKLLDAISEFVGFCPVMIQKFYAGVGFSHVFLADKGDIVYDCFHERLHEPGFGGGSSYRRIVLEPNGDFAQASRKIVKDIKWNGIGYLEYKYNKDREEYCLMELNGRFWGSINLHLDHGYDFALDYVTYATRNAQAEADKLTENNIDHPQGSKVIYERHLMKDLKWLLLAVNDASAYRDKFNILKKYLSEFSRVLRGEEKFDDFRTNEILNAIYGAVGIVRESFSFLSGIISRNRLWYKTIIKQKRRCSNLQFKGKKVLFVCKGNINRSPFAEMVLLSLLGRSKKSNYEVRSAGTLPRPGRKSPEAAVRTACRFGIDLSAHTSTTLSTENTEDSIVVVFDKVNLFQAVKYYSLNEDQIVPITVFLPFPRGFREIEDPHGKSDATRQKCFANIYECTNRLFQALNPE